MAKGKEDVADEEEDLEKEEWYIENGEGDVPEGDCIRIRECQRGRCCR